MTETNDAGQKARTGEDESDRNKSTEASVIDRTIDGALAGALVGGLVGLYEQVISGEAREQGYHATLEDGSVELTYVPERGSERPAAAMPPEHAQSLYRALSGDEDVRKYRVEETASGEVLNIHDADLPLDIPVMQILADDRDSLRCALASVLEDESASDLLDDVMDVFAEDNEFKVVGSAVEVSYHGEARFGDHELAQLRDSDLWASSISPEAIVVERESDA